MSSKENKLLAKERKAKERQKKERIRKVKIGGIVLLVMVILGALTYVSIQDYQDAQASSSSKETSDDTDTEDTDTEDTSDDAETTLNTTEGTVVEEGDTVNIDYTGYLDGEEFSGGSTDGAGADLELGSGTYIDGFEEQVEGHSVGETFDIEVTFPEDYGVDSLNGQTVTFTITINGVYE